MGKLPAFFVFLLILLAPSVFAQSTEFKWEKADSGTGDIAEIAISPTNLQMGAQIGQR